MITSGNGTNKSLLSSCLMHTNEQLPGQRFKTVMGIFFSKEVVSGITPQLYLDPAKEKLHRDYLITLEFVVL